MTWTPAQGSQTSFWPGRRLQSQHEAKEWSIRHCNGQRGFLPGKLSVCAAKYGECTICAQYQDLLYIKKIVFSLCSSSFSKEIEYFFKHAGSPSSFYQTHTYLGNIFFFDSAWVSTEKPGTNCLEQLFIKLHLGEKWEFLIPSKYWKLCSPGMDAITWNLAGLLLLQAKHRTHCQHIRLWHGCPQQCENPGLPSPSRKGLCGGISPTSQLSKDSNWNPSLWKKSKLSDTSFK